MKVFFEKKDLLIFTVEELRRMLNIQIKCERFEGASVIRDIIEERKKGYGIGNRNDDEVEFE